MLGVNSVYEHTLLDDDCTYSLSYIQALPYYHHTPRGAELNYDVSTLPSDIPR